MNNAEKFKQIFGSYATELWSMPESDFLAWLNRDVETTQIDHIADIGKKVSISCGQENDLISRQAALEAVEKSMYENMDDAEISSFGRWQWSNGFNTALTAVGIDLKKLPSAQPETAKRIVGKSRDGMTLWYQCDMCNEPVDVQDSFCRGCGRRLVNE